ncbi:MAG: hypothetical protein KGJ64_09560, partial [Betaproteobacteria bacterium]|nr:hypothetical protein [Betaproteobacteria bacterium]
MKKVLALASLSLCCIAAHAAMPGTSGVAVSADAGTLGGGVSARFSLSDNVDARLGLHGLNYSYNTVSQGDNYSGRLKLQNLEVFADWYPYAGSFHVTGGVVLNKDRFALNGQANNGTFTFNGDTYTADQVGAVQAKVSFNRVAPYLGVGWNTGSMRDAGWHLSSDIGLMYLGRPKATLTATGAAGNPALAADIAAAQAQLQSDLSKYR